jgi:hypothetical protein
MTDLRKAAEGALAVMTAKPSSITAADWADAIDALRAAEKAEREKEREACADIASNCCEGCADAIRARGEK